MRTLSSKWVSIDLPDAGCIYRIRACAPASTPTGGCVSVHRGQGWKVGGAWSASSSRSGLLAHSVRSTGKSCHQWRVLLWAASPNGLMLGGSGYNYNPQALGSSLHCPQTGRKQMFYFPSNLELKDTSPKSPREHCCWHWSSRSQCFI